MKRGVTVGLFKTIKSLVELYFVIRKLEKRIHFRKKKYMKNREFYFNIKKHINKKLLTTVDYYKSNEYEILEKRMKTLDNENDENIYWIGKLYDSRLKIFLDSAK